MRWSFSCLDYNDLGSIECIMATSMETKKIHKHAFPCMDLRGAFVMHKSTHCQCQHIGMQQLVKATCLWALTIWSLAMEIAPNNHHWSTNYENIQESIGLFIRVLTTKVLFVSYQCRGHEWFFLFFSFVAMFFNFETMNWDKLEKTCFVL